MVLQKFGHFGQINDAGLFIHLIKVISCLSRKTRVRILGKQILPKPLVLLHVGLDRLNVSRLF